MSRIALVGPGAIGCTLAAWLGHSSVHELVICARTAFARLEVETPEGPLVAAPTVLTSPATAGPVDWVLVTTKTYDVNPALPWLEALIGPGTRVALIQNGVEHLDRLPPATIPSDRIVPVIIDCPAERTAPGRVRQRGPAVITAPDDENGRAFAGLFAETPLLARTDADWLTVAWRKLCLNAPGAVSAVSLHPAGVSHHPLIADLMREITREAVAVGRAEGARLDDAVVASVVENYQRAPRDALNSLHADRLAGRPTEIDARNGAVVRFGRKHGIPTPYNEAMVALLSLEPPLASRVSP